MSDQNIPLISIDYLKHKLLNNDEKNSIVFQPSIKFIEDDFDEKQNDIYTEIKEARDNGMLTVSLGANNATMNKSFSLLTKAHFLTEVKDYSKTNKKGWKSTNIDRVVKKIFEEEHRNRILAKVGDGSRQLSLFGGETEFVFDLNSRTQNLFFLHGAFHIYNDGQCMKKITQQSDKALYDKLEEIINNEEKEIVCVFQHKDKTDVIENNGYLLNCLNKLGDLKGNMIIIGSSLADNDNHIFEKINSSEIETVYISTLHKGNEALIDLAKNNFSSKEIKFFNAETISYELTDEKE